MDLSTFRQNTYTFVANLKILSSLYKFHISLNQFDISKRLLYEIRTILVSGFAATERYFYNIS